MDLLGVSHPSPGQSRVNFKAMLRLFRALSRLVVMFSRLAIPF